MSAQAFESILLVVLWHSTLLTLAGGILDRTAILLRPERAAAFGLSPQVRRVWWLIVSAHLLVAPPLAAVLAGSVWVNGSANSSGSAPASRVALGAASQVLLVPVRAITTAKAELPSVAGVFRSLAIGAALVAVALVALSCVAMTRRRRRFGRALPIEPRVDAALARAASLLGRRSLPPVHITEGVGAPQVEQGRVLLPAQLVSELDDLELTHVLLHELAHLERRDALWCGVARAAELVYWWFPMARWARQRIAALTELSCDATVAACLAGETQAYRDTLLRYAARVHLGASRSRSATALGFDGGIVSRLQQLRVLDAATARRSRLGSRVVLVAGVGLILSASALAATERWQAARAQQYRNAGAILRAGARGERPGCIRLRCAAQFTWPQGPPAADGEVGSSTRIEGRKP